MELKADEEAMNILRRIDAIVSDTRMAVEEIATTDPDILYEVLFNRYGSDGDIFGTLEKSDEEY